MADQQNEKVYDVLIIGGGPCGLAVAIEAGQAGFSALVLEKGAIAESIRRYPLHMTFFSTSDNISLAGIPFPTIGPKANRSEALEYYRKVVNYFGLEILLYTEVTQFQKEKDIFRVHSKKGEQFAGRNLVLATGYFDRPRQLDIPGFDLPHVESYYKEAHPYARSKVVIIGGGNSASEAALDLYRHGAEVTLVVREPKLKPSVKYWLLPDLLNRIKEGNIKLILNTEVKEIREGSITIESTVEGAEPQMKELPADFVLSLIGYEPDVRMYKMGNIPYHPQTLVPSFDPETFETPTPGLFLAGTVTAGVRTERVFIENGRLHGGRIVKHLLEKKAGGKEGDGKEGEL